MMARKVPTLKQARQMALRGRVEEALPLLRDHADKGDTSASASLAELLAFQDEWQKCLEYAGAFIARPQSVYAGNIFDDMVHLLARAGRETRQWTWLLHLTQAAEQRVEENIAEYDPSKKEAERIRYSEIFQGLCAYAQGEGARPFELTRIFGVILPTQLEQDAAYQLAAQNALRQPPKSRNNPADLSRLRFILAQNYNQEAEGIRLYEDGQMPPQFDCAVFVAKAYVRQEQPDLAWNVLLKYVPRWWPVDRAQVAPVVLLIDSDLASIMNHERCETVLTLPRGPEAHTAD